METTIGFGSSEPPCMLPEPEPNSVCSNDTLHRSVGRTPPAASGTYIVDGDEALEATSHFLPQIRSNRRFQGFELEISAEDADDSPIVHKDCRWNGDNLKTAPSLLIVKRNWVREG